MDILMTPHIWIKMLFSYSHVLKHGGDIIMYILQMRKQKDKGRVFFKKNPQWPWTEIKWRTWQQNLKYFPCHAFLKIQPWKDLQNKSYSQEMGVLLWRTVSLSPSSHVLFATPHLCGISEMLCSCIWEVLWDCWRVLKGQRGKVVYFNYHKSYFLFHH